MVTRTDRFLVFWIALDRVSSVCLERGKEGLMMEDMNLEIVVSGVIEVSVN
jgi:hypothetical protein